MPEEARVPSGGGESESTVQAAGQMVGRFTVQQIQDILGRTGDSIGPMHPTQATSASRAVENILMYQEALALLRGGRPAEAGFRRDLYDWILGQPDLGGAAGGIPAPESPAETAAVRAATDVISGAQSVLLNRFSPPVGSRRGRSGSGGSTDRSSELLSLPTDTQAQLLDVLRDIQLNVLTDSSYSRYREFLPSLLALTQLLEGSAVSPSAAGPVAGGAVPRTTDLSRVAADTGRPTVQLRPSDFGSIVPLGMAADDAVAGRFTPELTPFLRNAMGCTAQDACSSGASLINTMSDVLTYGNQHDGSYSGLSAGSISSLADQLQQMHDLDRAPFVNDTRFTDAIALLRRSSPDVQGALELLGQLPDFNAQVLSAAQHVFSIQVNAEAIVIMSAGVTFRYNIISRSQEEIRAMIERAAHDPRVQTYLLWGAIGIYYQSLSISGQTTAAGVTTPWDAIGNQVSLRAEAGIGILSRRTPFEIVVHGSLDFIGWEHTESVPMAGGETRPLRVGQDMGRVSGLSGSEAGDQLSPGIRSSLYGIEFRFPVVDDRGRMVRFERFGIAGSGGQAALGYFTLSGRWYEGDRVSLYSIMTPEATFLLNQIDAVASQVRFGARVDPVDIAINLSHGLMLRFGPTLRGQYDINPSSPTFGTGRWEFGGTAELVWNRGITIGGGFTETWDESGTVSRRYSSGSVGLTLDIDRFGSRGRSRSALPRDAVPIVTAEIQITGDSRDAYLEAARFLDSPGEETLDGEAAQRMARDLAAFLTGFVGTARDGPRLARLPAFQSAITDLSAGRLQAGITALRTIPAFSSLEEDSGESGGRTDTPGTGSGGLPESPYP